MNKIQPKQFHIVNKMTKRLYELFDTTRFIGIDTETTGLNHRRDDLKLIQLCNKDKEVVLIRNPQINDFYLETFLGKH